MNVNRFFIVFSAILCLALMPLFTVAQPSGFAGSFSRVGFGPRGMGMGNALIAAESQGIYAYYNPALAAAETTGNQLDFSTALMTFGRNLHSLNATFALPPEAGINVALLNANVEGIDGRTSSGYSADELSTHEYQLLTAFGIRFHDKLSAGIGIKLNLANYHPELSNAKGAGFDVGLLYAMTETFSLGFALQDLLATYTWNSSELYGGESQAGDTERFPTRYTFGAALQVEPQLLLAFSYGLLNHDGLIFHQLNIGGNWDLHERLSVRAGWQIDDLEQLAISNRPSAGFSVHLPFDSLAPSVDYAFLLEPNQISSMHVFGLKLNL